MNYALFSGCKISSHLPQYGTATKAILRALDIEVKEPAFTCCGYAIRDMNSSASIFMAARNLALAEKNGLSIVTPCKCCFGSLKTAAYKLKHDRKLHSQVNQMLSREGLTFNGAIEVKHLLTVLLEDVGLSTIQKMRKNVFSGLPIAASYGCHALRPSNILGFDNPHVPTIFERLIEITGAHCVDWKDRMQCCGYPVKNRNAELARTFVQKKMTGALNAGARFLSSACTYCQLQYDEQNTLLNQSGKQDRIPSVLYPQLLGLSLGISPQQLGFNKNDAVLSQLMHYLKMPSPEKHLSEIMA